MNMDYSKINYMVYKALQTRYEEIKRVVDAMPPEEKSSRDGRIIMETFRNLEIKKERIYRLWLGGGH